MISSILAGIDHTPARLAMADAAIQSLTRLRPNSGEAHLALAKHLYWGYLDYDRAREELKLAQQSLPNDPLTFEILGFIDRRQGRWAESTKNLERAIELDPRNVGFLKQLADSYRLSAPVCRCRAYFGPRNRSRSQRVKHASVSCGDRARSGMLIRTHWPPQSGRSSPKIRAKPKT